MRVPLRLTRTSRSSPLKGITVDECRVVIADADTLFRHGLRAILEADGISVIADVDTGTAALAVIVAEHPDVALVDTSLPDISGLEIADQLSATGQCRVALLTANRRDSDLVAAARHHVDGYVLKSSPTATLTTAVRRIASGVRYADPALASVLFSTLVDLMAAGADFIATDEPADRDEGQRHGVDRRRAASLTVRELTILKHVARGETNGQIAVALGITTDTVKNHLANVRKKLDVTSRTHAVVEAVRAGVLELD